MRTSQSTTQVAVQPKGGEFQMPYTIADGRNVKVVYAPRPRHLIEEAEAEDKTAHPVRVNVPNRQPEAGPSLRPEAFD